MQQLPGEDELLRDMQGILVSHFRSNFAKYKETKGRQRGSTEWSNDAKKLVTGRFPFIKEEFVFHRRSKSAFDLYSPPHDLAIELAMFQGNAIYEFHKVLFKMLIAGPSYAKLVMVIPKDPGVRELRRPFNRISFEAFEKTHHFKILWMILDEGPKGWLGTISDLFGLYPPLPEAPEPAKR